MATSIQCNNKPARDDDPNARHRNDKLAFGFAGGGGHTTTITLDSSGGAGNTQLVRPQSGHNHLQVQQQQIQVDRPTLVDLLIDSQCDWRQLIGEANGPRETLAQHLSEMQIKRQEIIHELIQTERHHCLTLALMRQVYLAGLLQLNESRQRNSTSGQHQYVHEATSNTQRSPPGEPIDIERLFPALEELIQAHELFFAHLRLRLVECCQSPSRPYKPLVGIIGSLGDLLIEQFKVTPTDQGEHSSTNQEVTSTRCRRHKPKCHAHLSMDTHKHTKKQHKSLAQQQERTNTNGYKLLQAYAKFCGQHYESSRYYKQLLQFDKGFKQFIEQCNKQHAACRQRGIPECNLLVAQRLTKYPLLIEQLIKASKDEPNDEEEKLRRALGECRALLAELNSQLARKESFERLLDIYAQFSPKSHTIFYHKSALRFTKHDLLQHRRLRQLVHSDDQVRIWSATRRKLFPILCLILNDIIVFLRVDQQQQEQQLGSSSQQVVAAVVSAQLAAAAAAAHQLDHEAEAHDGHHEMATAATQSPSAGTNPNQQQQQQQQPPATTTTTPAPSVRYYFANIDNKSSVISLSKLLVREKAVEEAEPRVYLISSSPKQPEMYELAFISRRHQTTFCDKLKTAIEVHTRAKLLPDSTAHYLRNTRLQNWTSRDGQLDGNPFITGGQQVDQVESSGSSECCSLASCSSSSSSSSSSCGSSSSSLAGGSVGPATGSESQASDVDADDDEEHQRGETTLSTTGNGESAMTSQQVSPTKTTTTTTTSNCKRVDLELENLELDIEQDLVPAPSCLDLTTCCDIDDRPSERHAHEQTDAAREILARTESATPLSGGLPEIGPLSERARDSCDDLSSPRLLLGHGCRRQKARGNRKRRFQRPRQVSNQSTDSGATSGTSLTSGLGSGECLEFGAPSHQSSAKSPPVHQGGGASEQPDSTCGRGAGQEEEDLDSGRGRDDCSSSSSSSSHDSMTTGGGSTSATCQPNHPSETNELVAAQSSSSSPKSSISSEVGVLISPQVAATTTIQTGSQGPVTSPSAGGGHKQHLLKQRKLSTVSNLSSQMKLLQKLRSVGLLATTGSGGHTSDPYGAAAHNHQPSAQPLSLCANCIYQQHYKDALDDTTGTMSKRHLQQQHLRQLSKRRSLFVPEQKLEELRNLRIQLDKDKQEWQEKFDRMQEQLLNERRDLDLARERLKIDRTQIENEREQLYRKLEILKENGILLSPSHKVIITSPDQCARLMSGGQHQASQRLQHPPVYISNQTVMMQQQQAAHLMASARVPMHLSQQQHQQQVVGAQQAQQHYSGSIRSSGGGGLMSVLPGASFLVKRFGGGGGAGGTNQPINGKLSQSTLTISQHNHLQQQNHFANQSNHVLL